MRRGCLCSLFLATLVLALQGCASFYFHKAVFSPPPPRSLTLSDNPIREYWAGIVFNGSKIGFSHFRLASAAEEEKRFDIQSEAYFRIRFLMLEFSLIKCDTVISDPDRIHTLTVHISGLSDSVTLPNDDRQACTRGGNGSICRLSPLSEAGNQDPVLPDVETLSRYLAPTIAISARHPQISSLAKKIVAGADGDPQRIRALIDWIRQHIAREPVDVFTALDVLKGGRAECQGHALLYAAFARTLGIPTRIVNGIVYAPEFRGFLYHSWNESIVDGRWVAVDPTFGQIPVDATHIKLLEGQNLSDLIPLVDMIGKLKVRILSAE